MKLHILFVWLFIPNLFYAQNVGVGKPNPQAKLDVAGDIRSDTLASPDTVVVLADPDGTLIKLPKGETGQVLTSQGSTLAPIWMSANSSSSYAHTSFGTASIVPSVNVWRDLPGLSQTVNVASGDKLYIATNGGVQSQSGSAFGASFTDIGIFIDGALSGTSRRIPASNVGIAVYAVGLYSFEAVVGNLASGSHTISVKTKKYSNSFDNVWASSGPSGSPGSGNPPIQGTLTVIILK